MPRASVERFALDYHQEAIEELGTTTGTCRIGHGTATLLGPRSGFVAEGTVDQFATGYEGADYDFSCRVLISGNGPSGTYRYQRWYVRIVR